MINEKELDTALFPEENENGVLISEDVISTISSVAAKSVKGVYGMYTSLSGGFAEFLGKKNSSKGVKVVIEGQTCIIDLYIVVEYGAIIPDICWEIQDKVKNDVEAMTGLSVISVNINVEGVNVVKPAEAASSAPDLKNTEEAEENEE